MVCGQESGSGKSSVTMALLDMALKLGYRPSELAYIKPCTQCTEIQLVSKFCEFHGIAHRGVGPIVFVGGYTQVRFLRAYGCMRMWKHVMREGNAWLGTGAYTLNRAVYSNLPTFDQECIDGLHGTSSTRIQSVIDAVDEIGKVFVLLPPQNAL